VERRLVKQRVKQVVRRTVGEPYVGKRLKLRNLNHVLPALDLHPHDILDAGAEDATFVYWLADHFPEARVTAVDIDAEAIASCQDALPASYAGRVSFGVSYFSELEPESFDLITAFDVLEHIEDDAAAARDLFRALRPGGSLLVHVPRNVWTHRDGRQEVVPDDEAWKINAGHVRMGYSPESLGNLLEGAGFDVTDTQLWLRRWGVVAHETYARVERIVPLRLVTLPITDTAAVLDRRRPEAEGNTVFVRAVKP
jgi:SAM-dependent methyltransferase